jgi:ArsR family metal-binding transcriptional regulator
MATTVQRKRFISKRGEAESSDGEIIIDISDDDSVSVSDLSSDDEPLPEVEEEETKAPEAAIKTTWSEQQNKPQRR